MADDISMPDTGAEQLRIDIATDNVTGSDMNSLRDAGRALVDRGEMKPSSTEIDPIVVVDAGVLEHDDPDREGIDLRKTAKALSKYHQLKAQQKAQYESAAAQVQDAPQQQTQDEASALLQQLQHGELKAGLETRDNAELERLIIAAQADYPEVADASGAGMTPRPPRPSTTQRSRNPARGAKPQRERTPGFRVFANLVANGILARHGLSSPQELAQLQQYDPNRHALVLGELHHADLALANQAHEIKLRLGQRAQLQAQLSQQQFAEMAENEDAKFNSWTEAELNTPECGKRLAPMCWSTSTEGLVSPDSRLLPLDYQRSIQSRGDAAVDVVCCPLRQVKAVHRGRAGRGAGSEANPRGSTSGCPFPDSQERR